MPYASVLTRYWPPGALAWPPVARPEPGPGRIRICGHAAGVSPADPKIRRGDQRQVFPPRQSAVLGYQTTVHALGLAEAQLRRPDERLGLHKLRLEVSSCSVQELTALDTDQSSHGPLVP